MSHAAQTGPLDIERKTRVLENIGQTGFDVLVCSLPTNIRLLTGYWPVVGTSVAVVARGGPIALLVPEDEKPLAQNSFADRIETFRAGSLDQLTTASEAVGKPLNSLLRSLSRKQTLIGYEAHATVETSSYAAMHLYGGDLRDGVGEQFPAAKFAAADELLAEMRSVLTHAEASTVRRACELAAAAYREGARQIHTRISELEAAELFHAGLSSGQQSQDRRGGGFTYCMSGANAALAYRAYARSTAKKLQEGELVLVHCNSCVDGLWTDITRTYCLGRPDRRQTRMYEAIAAARDACLKAVRPGARAADVDRAAREILEDCGFGHAFKHQTGHGVPYSAIDHNARPRLHPKSADILRAGMVFNLEPAIYINGYGGLRHCDMVLVTDSGAELLSPFHGPAEVLQGLPRNGELKKTIA